LAQGRDERPVNPDQPRKSLSSETTFDTDITSLADLEDRLWPLCEKVALRARRGETSGRVVTLKLKGSDFQTITRRKTLSTPTQTARTVFAAGRAMLADETREGRAYRLIGIGVSDLTAFDPLETELFDGGEARARNAETAIDKLRTRFGPGAVVSGRAFKSSATD
jgi:DNA polymerase-4